LNHAGPARANGLGVRLKAKSKKLIAEYQREWNFTYLEYTTALSQKPGTNSPKRKSLLLAEAESLNHRLVALGIVFFEVVEQATPLADQHEKPAA
jgi:hypothetical protein